MVRRDASRDVLRTPGHSAETDDVRLNTADHPNAAILERNLKALAVASPGLVERLRGVPAEGRAVFGRSDEGVPWMGLSGGPGSPAQQLTSRRRPLEEADRLISRFDVAAHGVGIVLGFGAGYHVAAIAERMGRSGIVLVFEPDLPLLRAALERVDFSEVFANANVAIFDDEHDSARLSASLAGVEGVVAIGAKIVTHPPSKARLGNRGEIFCEGFTNVLRALRTSVVTTLMQVDVTVRNLLQNADAYATALGVRDLSGCARGRPAVVISAGPSLRRNIDQLADPRVRERVVLIATQTTLRPLLARGVRPHFVTALDYHEVSARFYEGLTPADVEGVTLVVEPKANPAILRAWPGLVRCPSDPVLDRLLGDGLARNMGQLPAGATVAHLAYYLARHLGADPVILVGQDLGFTDGLYYGPNAAIHDVWGSELNSFNTLEMLEHQRVARFGKLLRKRRDARGRPILTDEQMSAYLLQFERDFKIDAEAGLGIIDATEGGVVKAHAQVRTLAEALREHTPASPWRPPLSVGLRGTQAQRLELVAQRLRAVLEMTRELREACVETGDLLAEMIDAGDDRNRVNGLIHRTYALRDEATSLEPAYFLTQFLNQTGALNRFRADRTLELTRDLSPEERQRRQMERDATNVRWLRDSATLLEQLLASSIENLGSTTKVTRDPPPPPETVEALREQHPELRGGTKPARVGLVVMASVRHGGLGSARDLLAPMHAGRSTLELTLARLARCTGVDARIIVADEIDLVREHLAREHGASEHGAREHGEWRVEAAGDAEAWADRRRAVAAGRAFASACWRGGLGGLTIYDEAVVPALLAPLMESHGLDAVVVVNADWALVDPSIVSEVVVRYRERPDVNKLCFAQASPGLGAALIDVGLVRELAAQAGAAGPFASIGGLLGYIPVAPQLDPITRPSCVVPTPLVRDAAVRCVLDSPSQTRMLLEAADRAGGIERVDAHALCQELEIAINASAKPVRVGGPSQAGAHSSQTPPREIELEVVSRDGDTLRHMSPLGAERVLRAMIGPGEPVGVTLRGEGTTESLQHPEIVEIARTLRRAGATVVHLRTKLALDQASMRARIPQLVDGTFDVISIDLDRFEQRSITIGAATGVDPRASLDALLAARDARVASAGGIATPWIVPRLERRDATLESLDEFCKLWLMRTGAAVIDPPSEAALRDAARVEVLPRPERVRRRTARELLRIDARGAVFMVNARTDTLVRVGAVALEHENLAPELQELWIRGVDAASCASPAEHELPIAVSVSPVLARVGSRSMCA
ncbi:MAG: 6-hydroxymethylpterin diphosphokinase MptE-like protein [Planctomycetota bacterium]|nr:6-hydroxymethylpterin diphosphokinase MptE-like protein [Planctomycetota bacterium]